VQNGWIRASERKLAPNSDNIFKQKPTLLQPIPTMREADASPLPSGSFTKVTIPLYFQGHAYRTGSQIKVTIAAPNGTQPIWAFDTTQPSTGTAKVSLAYSSSMPSRLVLPVIPGLSVDAAAPACPSLRNEPCR
jgi:hypothetical protein